MSLRSEAREQAESLYAEAVKGLFGLIERRIEWRRANAPQLALEAERMIYLIERAPRISFRRVRLALWRYRHRKHDARAWAENKMLQSACRLASNARALRGVT